MSSSVAISYGYNGLGDRLSQTVNSVTTNYTLDMATGLTQVLADGTNTSLSGPGPIGEQQPGKPNPYTPWGRDPLGALLGPVSLLLLMRRSRKKPGEYDRIL